MTDLLSILRIATLASSAAVLFVLTMRHPMRCLFRPRVAYSLWLLVPLVTAAALMPASIKIVDVKVPAGSVQRASHSAPIAEAKAGELPPHVDAALVLTCIWFAGAAAMLAMFLWQQRRFVKNLGKLSAVTQIIFRAQTTDGCPALVGALSPRIVIPADFDQRYSENEQRVILAHERHHRARGDAQINAVCMLARCVFWFNPLIHLGARYFRFDQELACDAAVIVHMRGARRSYASAMLKTQIGVISLPIGCYWPSINALRQRIQLLKQPVIGPARTYFGAAIMLSLMFAVSYLAHAMQPQRVLVNFVDTPASTPQIGGARPTNHVIEKAKTATRDRNAIAKSQSQPSATTAAPILASNERALVVLNSDRLPTENPSYRETFPPRYPPQAVRNGIEGRVTLRVRVDELGRPIHADIASIEPASADVLASAAVAAVMHWRFAPAMREGKAASGIVMVPFDFSLNGTKFWTTEQAFADASETKSHASRSASYRTLTAIDYPPEHAHANVEGTVYVKAHVTTDGSVDATAVDSVQPESARVLSDAATRAVAAWKFNPARAGNRDVETFVTVPIVFALRSDVESNPHSTRRNAMQPVVVVPKI